MQDKSRDSIGTIATVATIPSSDDDKEDDMPWEEEGWIPIMKSGKQRTPNMIRNEIQRYINEGKAKKSRTQTDIIEEIGVSSHSFRRFMDPKNYKDQWSAVQNQSYWEVAKFLEKLRYEKEQEKKKKKAGGSKRKAVDQDQSSDSNKKGKSQSSSSASSSSVKPKSKAEKKAEAEALIQRILAVEGVSDEGGVYDSCPQLVTKINKFLARDGVSKAMVQRALGVHSSSFSNFLSSKKQDQCMNRTYKASYVFFEKLRILEGNKKTNARLKNEVEQPGGFSLKIFRGTIKWFPFMDEYHP